MLTLQRIEALIERAKKAKSVLPYVAVFENGTEKTFSGSELVEILSRTGSGIIEIKQIPGTPKEGELLDLLNGLIGIEESEDTEE